MDKNELEQKLGSLTYGLLQIEARIKPLQEEHTKVNNEIIKTVNEITELGKTDVPDED